MVEIKSGRLESRTDGIKMKVMTLRAPIESNEMRRRLTTQGIRLTT